jgi:beta-lactamase regulating signal transducer with metallopeptidase domain
LILAIAFRGVIWRLIWSPVRFMIGIIWFFSPIRLLLKLFSKNEVETSTNSNGDNTKKPNGTNGVRNKREKHTKDKTTRKGAAVH